MTHFPMKQIQNILTFGTELWKGETYTYLMRNFVRPKLTEISGDQILLMTINSANPFWSTRNMLHNDEQVVLPN